MSDSAQGRRPQGMRTEGTRRPGSGNPPRIDAVTGVLALLVTVAAALFTAAFVPISARASSDIEHLHYVNGPLTISPGQNLIELGPNPPMQQPSEDGYIIGGKPGLTLADGSVPPVTVIHLHHGVLLNASRQDATDPAIPERIAAAGEEKTYLRLPDGYGYPYRKSDVWVGNFMIHNLTAQAQTVYITTDFDFVPASSPLAKTIRPVRPLWMDVRNGEAYPVFNALRQNGHGGISVYPDDYPGVYGGGRPLNEWTVDRPGTLVFAAGHVHPGGLWDDMDLQRAGASIATPASRTTCTSTPVPASQRRRARSRRHRSRRVRRHARHARRIAAHPGASPAHTARRHRHRASSHRRRKAHRPTVRPAPRTYCSHAGAPPGPVPGSVPHSVRIFRSHAISYDPGGHVSWDISMTRTDPSWRVAVKPGDVLRIRSAYDTSKASWYESMGIMVMFMADNDASGVDPFKTPVPTTGPVTHGPLPENAPSGGQPNGVPDPGTLPATQAPADTVHISDFSYVPGGESLSSPFNNVPSIQQGQQLTFVNEDASAQVFHSITGCRQPCTASYGNSYPLADGPSDFDSGQLGYGPPGLTAAVNRVTWQTPSNLAPGTYTYFCRIHPWMRGAFRIIRA